MRERGTVYTLGEVSTPHRVSSRVDRIKDRDPFSVLCLRLGELVASGLSYQPQASKPDKLDCRCPSPLSGVLWSYSVW